MKKLTDDVTAEKCEQFHFLSPVNEDQETDITWKETERDSDQNIRKILDTGWLSWVSVGFPIRSLCCKAQVYNFERVITNCLQ